jgi:hypothetical protein
MIAAVRGSDQEKFTRVKRTKMFIFKTKAYFENKPSRIDTECIVLCNKEKLLLTD